MYDMQQYTYFSAINGLLLSYIIIRILNIILYVITYQQSTAIKNIKYVSNYTIRLKTNMQYTICNIYVYMFIYFYLKQI